MKNSNTITATSNQLLLPEKPQTLTTLQETPRYPVQPRKAQCNIGDHTGAGYHNNGITICAETVTNSDPICEDGMDKEGLDAVKTAMENPGETSIEPLPLERAVDKPVPYPLDALGNLLGRLYIMLSRLLTAYVPMVFWDLRPMPSRVLAT